MKDILEVLARCSQAKFYYKLYAKLEIDIMVNVIYVI